MNKMFKTYIGKTFEVYIYIYIYDILVKSKKSMQQIEQLTKNF